MSGVAGAARSRRGASIAERIELHTDRTSSCWVWTGAIDKGTGYGRIMVGGRGGYCGYSHRESYIAHVGPIPDGLQIDHLCRNRACCNPAHLEAVTPQVNVLRGDSPGARALQRDLCFHGMHLYVEYGVEYEGRRKCGQCQRDYCALWKQVPYVERMRRKFAGEPVVDLAAHYAAQRSEEVAA